MLIAVYGTLKKDKHNHRVLGNAKFISKSHTGEGYALFVNHLPYLVKRDDGRGCEIEIYEIDSVILQDLDHLEGHPVFYTRSVLRNENGEDIQIYLYNDVQNIFSKMSLKHSIESF